MNTNSTPLAAILSLDMKNLKGERWRDIPGFEGLYKISNFGRIKSLPRYAPYKGRTDAYSLRKGRIISLRKTVSRGDYMDMQMKLHKDGLRYAYSVGRMVYYVFVSAFEWDDHSIIVTREDGNYLNCHYKNLRLVSVSEVALQGYRQQKRKSAFQDNKKRVTQYCQKGNLIGVFDCAVMAATATGIAPRQINDAAKRKIRLAGGYYWRYQTTTPTINVRKLSNRRTAYQRSRPKKVIKLTLSGRPLKTYDTLSAAAAAVGMNNSANISAVCRGIGKSCKGYRWKYADDMRPGSVAVENLAIQ